MALGAVAFDQQHQPVWAALQQQLDALQAARTTSGLRSRLRLRRRPAPEPVRFDAALCSTLYRQACEHLALARSRGYPLSRVQALELLTSQAHQVLYRHQGSERSRVLRLLRDEVPAAMRRHRWHIGLALLAFALPFVAMGLTTWHWPSMVLTLLDVREARHFEEMYRSDGESIGRMREAGEDLTMFGYYISHNIGIAFQCLASGVAVGLGSLVYLLFNGVQLGAVAGYLTAMGHGGPFWAFVATHSAFELTGIVISGGIGLRLGQAVLMPGREPRVPAMARAGREVLPLIVLTIALLVIAAAVEAFWSSAAWVQPSVKYTAAAVCWVMVLAYLTGRFGARPVPTQERSLAL